MSSCRSEFFGIPINGVESTQKLWNRSVHFSELVIVPVAGLADFLRNVSLVPPKVSNKIPRAPSAGSFFNDPLVIGQNNCRLAALFHLPQNVKSGIEVYSRPTVFNDD